MMKISPQSPPNAKSPLSFHFIVHLLLEALSFRSRFVEQSNILMLGVDQIEAPSQEWESSCYDIMSFFQKQGARVSYHDPHMPIIGRECVHRGLLGHSSILWDTQCLSFYDAAVVCTAHEVVDYAELAQNVPVIVDACNVVPTCHRAEVINAASLPA